MSTLAKGLIGVSLALMLVLGVAVGSAVSDDESWEMPAGMTAGMHGTEMDAMFGQHMASMPNHMRAMGMTGMGMDGMARFGRRGMPPMHGRE